MEKQKNNKLHRQLFVSLRHHVGDSFIEKQRLLIYIYVSIGGGLLLILNLLGLSGPMGKYYFIANSINLFFITFLLLAFLRKYINLENAVIGLMSVCQLFCISEMLFITFTLQNDAILIIGNMILLIGIIFLSTLSHLKPSIISIQTLISLIVYTICCFTLNDSIQPRTYGVLVITFILSGFLGYHLTRKLTSITQINNNLEQIQKEMISLFNIDKNHINHYIRQSHTQGLTAQHTNQYLKIILENQGTPRQKNIKNHIAKWHEQTRIDYQNIKSFFPELSPSEQEIATLILKGYQLKDICSLTDKKESNVNCQRSNIRRKLQIPPEKKLRHALLQTITQKTIFHPQSS